MSTKDEKLLLGKILIWAGLLVCGGLPFLFILIVRGAQLK